MIRDPASLLVAGRASLPILMYHSFGPISCRGLKDLGVPLSVFREQMVALVDDGFEVCSVREATKAVSERPGDKVVAITIDDGYVDSLAGAEVLREVGASATVYIPTASLGQPTAVYLRSKAKAVPRPLTWSEVRALADLGMEIGSHSHTHVPLDVMSPSRARSEMMESRELLESATGSPVRSLCYPNGYHSRRTRTLASEAGYDNACAIGHRIACLATDDLYALPRLLVRPHLTGPEVLDVVTRRSRRKVDTIKSTVEQPWRWVRKGAWVLCRYPLT